MKKTIAIFILISFLLSGAAWSTDYYGCNAGQNHNSDTLWCTYADLESGSPAACTKAAGGSYTAAATVLQAGNTLYANGCTIAIVGNFTATKISTEDGGGGANDFAGGGFTYATSVDATVTSQVKAGTTTCVTITGSTGGGTFVGAVTGGTSSGAYGIYSTHTSVTVSITGNVSASSGQYSYGAYINAIGRMNITGDIYASSGTYAPGFRVNAGGISTIVGDIYGSNSNNSAGVDVVSGTVDVTGSLIYGTKGPAITGFFVYTPAATDFVLFPKSTTLYTRGTIDANATLMPTDPGAANVKSGVAYGPNTGTLATGGGSWGF